MKLWENFRTALTSLGANKLRSVLTVLGIIIGVAAVITLQAIGQGFVDTEQKSLESGGSNLITIEPAQQQFGSVAVDSNNINLTYEDAQALADSLVSTQTAAVEPELFFRSIVIAGSANLVGGGLGTTEQFPLVRDTLHVAVGDWFSDQDVSSGHLVVVLGSDIALRLAEEPEKLLGEHIRVQQVSLVVVGILAPTSQKFFDLQVFVPITTVQQRLLGKRPVGASGSGSPVSSIVLKANGSAEVQSLKEQATELLRERHKIEDGQRADFEITTQDELLQRVKDQFTSLNIFLAIVASITLLVGGIGVMNIMLVSVTERTREIGVRKAVGARPLDILYQFIIESIILSLLGGLIGMLVGIGAALMIGAANLEIAGSALHPVVSPFIVMVAMGAAMSVGLFFGIYPAHRASRLRPIEALRYE